MQPGRRIAGFMIMLGAILVLSVTIVGCTSGDFGAVCDLPPSACESNDGTKRSSCVEDPTFACETGACGRYKGSEGFCTMSCESDSDCPSNGVCETFILVTDTRYCVPTNEPDLNLPDS